MIGMSASRFVVAVLVLGVVRLSSGWILTQNHPHLRFFRTTTTPTRSDFRRALTLQQAVRSVAAAGVEPDEWEALRPRLAAVCRDCIDQDLESDGILFLPSLTGDPESQFVGISGRVLLLSIDSWVAKDGVVLLFDAATAAIDELLQDETARTTEGHAQPILLYIQPENVTSVVQSDSMQMENLLQTLISNDIDQYGLADIVGGDVGFGLPLTTVVPTDQFEVDGATVRDPFQRTEFWDTSSVLVFDGLVTRDLRQRLLELILDETNSDEKWDDVANGPNPSRWVRGGLMDIPAGQGSTDEAEESDSLGGYGLTDEAIDELCFEDHEAIEEFESIVSALFPHMRIARLPEAVLGSSVSPLTANAPIHGHSFKYHIDADPNLVPQSPWADVYGRYPNRTPGKPRFISCLVYLNDEWDYDAWGAPTRFLDYATESACDIQPKPGRIVFMDQDVTHTVVAPMSAAGLRPRYSLVWKLILHPTRYNQDMTDLAGPGRNWPAPTLIGSAKR